MLVDEYFLTTKRLRYKVFKFVCRKKLQLGGDNVVVLAEMDEAENRNDRLSPSARIIKEIILKAQTAADLDGENFIKATGVIRTHIRVPLMQLRALYGVPKTWERTERGRVTELARAMWIAHGITVNEEILKAHDPYYAAELNILEMADLVRDNKALALDALSKYGTEERTQIRLAVDGFGKLLYLPQSTILVARYYGFAADINGRRFTFNFQQLLGLADKIKAQKELGGARNANRNTGSNGVEYPNGVPGVSGVVVVNGTGTRNTTATAQINGILHVNGSGRLEGDIFAVEAGKVPDTAKKNGVDETLHPMLEEALGKAELIGRSAPMLKLFKTMGLVMGTDARVMLFGKTGTGKELVAKALHYGSPRSENKFVAVNCAAIAPGLLTSELFGHEKGAFTGANKLRRGRFEEATGGTLFLDEMQVMSAETQIHFLRVLQEQMIERVGSSTPIKLDVRLVAATNVDPHILIEEGKLREDLFYRLAVVPMELPALRERDGDIGLLAKMFFEKAAKKYGRAAPGINDDARQFLETEYAWPGNVRQLQNFIELAVLLKSGETLGKMDVQGLLQIKGKPGHAVGQHEKLPTPKNITECKALAAEMRRLMIVKALEDAGGRPSAAALALGMNLSSFHLMRNAAGITCSKKVVLNGSEVVQTIG